MQCTSAARLAVEHRGEPVDERDAVDGLGVELVVIDDDMRRAGSGVVVQCHAGIVDLRSVGVDEAADVVGDVEQLEVRLLVIVVGVVDAGEDDVGVVSPAHDEQSWEGVMCRHARRAACACACAVEAVPEAPPKEMLPSASTVGSGQPVIPFSRMQAEYW